MNKTVSFLVSSLFSGLILLGISSHTLASEVTPEAELKSEILRNSSKFGVHAMMMAIDNKGGPLAALILQAANLAKSLPGNELYLVQRSLEDPDLIFITEVWTSQKAHQDSLNNPKILSIIEQARPLIEGIDNNWAVPLGGNAL